jgi:hypothetical protein
VPPELPSSLRPLGECALQYLLQDVSGTIMPLVTAVFWSDPNGPGIAAGEPWPDVVKNGAVLVERQLLGNEVALSKWAEACALSAAEKALVEAIYRRRVLDRRAKVQLTAGDMRVLQATAMGDEGWRACRESFAEIGVEVP